MSGYELRSWASRTGPYDPPRASRAQDQLLQSHEQLLRAQEEELKSLREKLGAQREETERVRAQQEAAMLEKEEELRKVVQSIRSRHDNDWQTMMRGYVTGIQEHDQNVALERQTRRECDARVQEWRTAQLRNKSRLLEAKKAIRRLQRTLNRVTQERADLRKELEDTARESPKTEK